MIIPPLVIPRTKNSPTDTRNATEEREANDVLYETSIAREEQFGDNGFQYACRKGCLMDAERKRQLKQDYYDRKPDKGVLGLRCIATDEVFLIASSDLKATQNGLITKLSGGGHPNKHLRALWAEYGEEGFAFEVIETLEYDDPHEDHTEELQALLELCLEENPAAARVWK